MDLSARLEALLTLAEAIGVDVRAEPMGGEGGGLCRLRGTYLLFVDTSADLATRYDRTLAAMASVPGLDEQYIVPELRDDLERQSSSRGLQGVDDVGAGGVAGGQNAGGEAHQHGEEDAQPDP